jgi:hypothetical protein
VLVDIGYKSEGVIPAKELSIRNAVNPSELAKVGDPVEALVLQMEDAEGRLILSKKRAQYERAWGRIEKVMEEKGTVTGQVIEVVKGGLIVDIGLRGFLPASLVELRRVRDLHPYVGQTLEARSSSSTRIATTWSSPGGLISRRAGRAAAGLPRRTQVEEIRDGVVSSVVNRRLRRPGRHGRLGPRLRLSLATRQPPVGDGVGGRQGEGQGAEVDLDRERIPSIRQTGMTRGSRSAAPTGSGTSSTAGHEDRAVRGIRVRCRRRRGPGARLEIAIHHVESPEWSSLWNNRSR